MLKRTFYLSVLVIIVSFILGCAGNDEDLINQGTVELVGSVSVKSYESDINGTTGAVRSYENRDGVTLTVSRQSDDGGYVFVDTTISYDGTYTLLVEQYGTYRISARINDFIPSQMDSLITITEKSQAKVNVSPIEFGPYYSLNNTYLKCDLPKPNPASNSTNITFKPQFDGYVTLKTYNTEGTLIKTILENQSCLAGTSYPIDWNFLDNNDNVVADDIYFFVLKWVQMDDASIRWIHIGTIIKE